MIEIQEINLSNKKERSLFIDMQWDIYRDFPHWVPQLKMALHDVLNPKTHPFYQTSTVKCFLALENKKPVGRIMAIINHTQNKLKNEKAGAFGFFESINSKEVSRILFKTAENWLKSEGITKVEGPYNPSTNYDCGLLINKFDNPPQVMMPYNPPYYLELVEDYGFIKSMDLLAYRIDADFKMPDIIMRIAERNEKKGNITYRKLNLKNWTQELDHMYAIYNSAWEANWGFIPMTKEEFYHTAKELKTIVDPNLVHFVEVNGEMAGFILTLPDLNQIFKQIPDGNLFPTGVFKLLFQKKKYVNRSRTITMGIKKEFRKMGLETLLYKHNYIELQKAKIFKEFEMSWILETNLEMNKPLLTMGAEAYKTYRLFEKTL